MYCHWNIDSILMSKSILAKEPLVKEPLVKEPCKACNKLYIDLTDHHVRTKLCKDWIELLEGDTTDKSFDSKLGARIQSIHSPSFNTIQTTNQCKSCNKMFSNVGNLNKHISNNIICQKWKEYHKLQKRNPFKLDLDCDKTILQEFPYRKFIDIHHIIWNVFLTDKQSSLTEDDIKETNIKRVIMIFPEKYSKDFSKDSSKEIPEFIKGLPCDVLDYKYDDSQDYTKFDSICEKIETYRKERQNILVLCYNGYQRSIPFLCYYLTTFHKDEIPDNSRALDIILSQVDKSNYPNNKEIYLKMIDTLK